MVRSFLCSLDGCLSRFFAGGLGSCHLEAHACEKPRRVRWGVGEKHRDPMQLVHVVGGIHAVRRPKGAEHFRRQLEIHHVDHLVAVKAEFAAGHAHHDGIPLAIAPMPEHRRLKIPVKGIIRRRAVSGEAMGEKLLLGHY